MLTGVLSQGKASNCFLLMTQKRTCFTATLHSRHLLEPSLDRSFRLPPSLPTHSDQNHVATNRFLARFPSLRTIFGTSILHRQCLPH